MDELDWDEKNLDDFVAPEIHDEQENLPLKQNSCSKTESSTIYGREYPYDIWFRIGTYIAPEDIGRFALICRTTNQVVNSTAFWISIFNK